MRAFRWIKLQHALAALLPLWLGACAVAPPGQPGILLETAVRGQPVAGATCAASIGPVHWDVTTPAVLALGDARGELRIVCEKPGFRTSELIFRSDSGGSFGAASGVSAGFGSGVYGSGLGLGLSFPLGGTAAHFPKRLVIDLNPA